MIRIDAPESADLVAAAIDYAGQGLRILAVYGVRFDEGMATGCRCGRSGCPEKAWGKHPVGEGWQRRATSDAAQVRAWLDEKSGSNIGLALGSQGPGGLYLIAIDKDDAARLAVLEAELGALPQTVESISGSGRGGHAIYVAPAELPPARFKNNVGVRLANETGKQPGIDVRAAGGQIVLAPSIHRSGQPYAWVRTGEVATLPMAWALAIAKPVADRPEWVGKYTPTSIREDRKAQARAEKYVETAVHSEARLLANCGEGMRNDSLYRAAFSLLSLAAGVHQPWEWVLRELFGAAKACGLKEFEARRTLESAERAVTASGASRVPKPQEAPRASGAHPHASVNGSTPPPRAQTPEAQPEGWRAFKLTTITTDPPRHEIVAPGGEIIRLTTADLLSPVRFTAKYLDAIGSLPELPEKNRGEYLRNVATLLFESRAVVQAAPEAGARGTLLEDVRTLLRASPQTDEPLDMGQGALLVCRNGARAFNARVLYERTRRVSPLPVDPADFYEALRTIGAVQRRTLRHGTWRNHAWVVPAAALEDAAADPSGDEDHAPQASDQNGQGVLQ